MSTAQIVILFAVCAAFVVFAVALAWGDYQTRNIRHNLPAKPQGAPPARLHVLKTETATSAAKQRTAMAK